jgi:hypothetical protein
MGRKRDDGSMTTNKKEESLDRREFLCRTEQKNIIHADIVDLFMSMTLAYKR